MPIVIQEIIASDTISQAADKINFNFDQLLLNGGGPSGPSGPTGPQGPIGGRGERGSRWYEDTNPKPGSPPTGLIFSNLIEDDNYLQSNGNVWTWDGSSWIQTGVNLTGPQGSAGISVGLSFFGGNPPSQRLKTSIYPAPFDTTGATPQNEGISTGVFGAAINADTLSPGSQGYSVLSDTLATSINSSITSLFIHQKTSGSKSIIFHGGTLIDDYFEQDAIGELSNISLGVDDTLIINSPKAPQNPQSDLIGLRVLTGTRGQQFRAGKNIEFTTGLDENSYPADVDDTSNFTVNVNGYSGLEQPPKISLNVLYTGNEASLNIGGLGTIPPSTTKNGKIIGEAGNIGLTGNLIRLNSNANTNIQLTTSGISLNTSSGDIDISAFTGSNNVNILGVGINLNAQGNGITLGTSNNVEINSTQTNINSTLNVADDTVIEGWFNVSEPTSVSTFNGTIRANNLPDVSPSTGNLVVKDPNNNNQLSEIPQSQAAPIPVGGIIMWSGGTNNIPTGWTLCDGNDVNGVTVPDLRQRFVVGVGDNPNVNWTSQNNGATGGEIEHNHGGQTDDHTLTLSQIPEHDHVPSYLDSRFGYLAGWTRVPSGEPNNSPAGWRTASGTDTGDGGSPEMLISSIGGTNTQNIQKVENTRIQPEGGNVSHNHGIQSDSNLPPYYALAFIMYVGT